MPCQVGWDSGGCPGTRGAAGLWQGLLIHPFQAPEAKVRRNWVNTVNGSAEEAGNISFVTRWLNRTQRLATHSPLENFFCLLFRYLDSQVPQRLHDLLGINASWNHKGCEPGARLGERPGTPPAAGKCSPSFFLSKLLKTSLSFFS